MKNTLYTFIFFLSAVLKLCRPGGAKALAAENVALRKQLAVANRKFNKCPSLTPFQRIVFAFLYGLISPKR